MRIERRPRSIPVRELRSALLAALLVLAVAPTAQAQSSAQSSAQSPALSELLSGVVRMKAFINPDGRTAPTLGREREGSAIVIDNDGLILTIGYLMVEAHSAEVVTNDGQDVPANIVGYDHQTGFGLLRAIVPLKVRPLAFGKSAALKERDPVVVASFGGPDNAEAAMVVAKREFAGNWEYLLDQAIFTAPPHPAWSGAALLDHEGKLVGVGSLIVGDATGKGTGVQGNMFVPTDLLPPILADLLANGRAAGVGRPWLGVNTDEMHGHLMVSAVTRDGPADHAGLKRGDIILGVNGEPVNHLPDFYRKLYAQGDAGTLIRLDVLKDNEQQHVEVKSINRLDHLRLKSSF
ncbi:MAG TPA: S1C family serine protease [Xanthobacteraceae bacterium]|jgi:S1-C subfamily serine protease